MGLVGRQFYSREAVIYGYIPALMAVLNRYYIAPNLDFMLKTLKGHRVS